MANAIAIKTDEDLFRELHVRAAKKGLSTQEYVTGLIKSDLFPKQTVEQIPELSKDQAEQLKAAVHAMEANLCQIMDVLNGVSEQSIVYTDMNFSGG